MKVNLKPVKDHLPEILTGIGVGSEALASFLYIYNSKKLYEKNPSPTKKDYIKAYAAPVILSSASITAIIFSDRLQQKEKARLLAMNAAIVASSLQKGTYSKELEKRVDPKEVQNIQDKLTQRDLDGMIDDAVKSDQLNENRLNDVNIYFFPQVRKMIFATDEALCGAVQALNEELSVNDFASFADFFSFIDPSDHHYDDLDQLGWMYIYGMEIQTYKREVHGFPVIYVNFDTDPLYYDEWGMYYDWINKVSEKDKNEKSLPF